MSTRKPSTQAARTTPAGTLILSAARVKAGQVRRGLSDDALANLAGVHRNTVLKARNQRPVYRDTARRIAEALQTTISELIEGPDDSSGAETSAGTSARIIGGEWEIAETLGPWITASNGLQFRLHRLRHLYVTGREGRGKCYDLAHLSNAGRASLREHLVRHPTVCERIGVHPHIVENLSTHPGAGDQEWWVIDRWLDGTPLSARLQGDPLEHAVTARLMTDIGRGLAAMHHAKVVFRELAPSRVYLADGDGRAVLTEFELAKLLDPHPTVSADWPDDAYRAPEVAGGVTTAKADIYSWARILTHAVCGELPEPGSESQALAAAGLPGNVCDVATRCLSDRASSRPKTIEHVLEVVEQYWAGN